MSSRFKQSSLRALIAAFMVLFVVFRSAAQQSEILASKDANKLIRINSPLDYEVFQRQTKAWGEVLVSGAVIPVRAAVEARFHGSSPLAPLSEEWHPLRIDVRTGGFREQLRVPAGGFYVLELRMKSPDGSVASLVVPHVGVGEVFVIAGQSNSTNYGETLQSPQTGMVTSFDGSVWRIADDPQIGAQDGSKKGSFIPSFGDALYRKYGVPVGVASVGHGSTSVRQWLPAGDPVEVMPTMTKFVTQATAGTLICDGTLFNGLMARIQELGPNGFRAILWHQGESDGHQPVEHEISPATYERMLEHIIQSTRQQAGWNIPWFVAQATYHSAQDASNPGLRQAQSNLWTNGTAFRGPDTDALTAAYREKNGTGVHLNDAGLKAHGSLWAERVEEYLDSQPH